MVSFLKCPKWKLKGSIIVIEDDCIINPSIKDTFKLKIEQLKEFLDTCVNWDLFLGGPTYIKPENIIKKLDYSCIPLFEINEGRTTHFMIYNHTCYEYYLNSNEYNCPVDEVWHNKLRGLCVYPFLAYQLNDYSSIEKVYVNYNRYFKSSEDTFRSFLKKKINITKMNN